MNDTELAEKVVAAGVGSISQRDGDNEYCIMAAFIRADQFVRDWRVAGAFMEQCARRKRTIALSFGCDVFNATDAESATPTYGVYLERPNESAPRAIIEACVEAPL